MMIIGGVDMAVYGGARQRYDTADDHRRCGRQGGVVQGRAYAVIFNAPVEMLLVGTYVASLVMDCCRVH